MARLIRSIAVAYCATGLFVIFAAPGGTSPPSNQSVPIITGVAQAGQTLTCDEGGWNGTAPISYAFQWKRNGSAISGASSETYQVTTDDVAAAVTCAVTASSPYGTASATSTAVTPVGADSPAPSPGGSDADAIAPTITGFTIAPRKFRILYRTCKNNKQTKIPTVRFRYTLSEAANVKITTRFVGRGAKKTKAGDFDGSMALAGKAGSNETKFGSQLHGRYVLMLGAYKATIRATDAAGNKSAVAETTFKVLVAERGDGKQCVIGNPGRPPSLKIP